MRFMVWVMALLITTTPLMAVADQVPPEYQQVLTILGRKGDYKDHVLKIGLPRTDLQVTVRGMPVPTALGFGGWLAVTRGSGDMDVMMGDLVLLEDQVNPVMSALLDHGLEVTALHNHFFWENPRVFYMHVHGHGHAADLARAVKPALDLMMAQVAAQPASSPAAAPVLDVAALESVIRHKSEAPGGGVVKFVVGRPDLHIHEMGALINSRMGLNTWAAFMGTDEHAAVAGDVAMLESEVTPVLITLRHHNINVVAIHHHMTGTHPMIIFLHYWGEGRAQDLARAFRAVLDRLGTTHVSASPDHRP